MGVWFIRKCFDLCQLKIGTIMCLAVCGVVLGALCAAVTKKPAVDNGYVQPSFGQAQAASHKAEQPTAGAAPLSRSVENAGETLAIEPSDLGQGKLLSQVPPPRNAYNILAPDWGGACYRLKTIVNQ